MSVGTVRRLVFAVCVAGIGGMIAGSIADNNAFAMTFGLASAVAVLLLIVANAVTTGPGDPEPLARDVEASGGRLVDAGADEGEVRGLVRAAVRLGRGER